MLQLYLTKTGVFTSFASTIIWFPFISAFAFTNFLSAPAISNWSDVLFLKRKPSANSNVKTALFPLNSVDFQVGKLPVSFFFYTSVKAKFANLTPTGFLSFG